MSKNWMKAMFASTALAIGGCGGGGGGGSNVAPPPAADTTPPVITLTGSSSQAVEQGTSFDDPGATATDNRDGSVSVTVTGSVDVNVAGEYTLTYTATDAAGNTATATRVVTVADTLPPVISLNGDEAIALAYGTEYADEGAVAVDSVDGNVTVTSEGTVDIFTPGEYVISYTATDAVGNVQTSIRTITIGNQTFRLDVSLFGEGGVTIDSDAGLTCNNNNTLCSQDFTAGTVVKITSNASSGWTFRDWNNCDVVEDATCTLTMDRDRLALTAFNNMTPLTFQPKVVQLTEAQISSVQNFNVENNILSFAAGADLTGVEVGNILVASGGADGDIVFGKRVIDIIALSGSSTLVETINATMDEIVAEGTVSVRAELTDDVIDPKTLPEGMFLKSSDLNSGKVSLGMVNAVIYDKDGLKVTATGSLNIGLNPDIDFYYKLGRGLDSYRLATGIETEANYSVKFSGTTTALSRQTQKDILTSFKLAPIVVGPLVFIMDVQPYFTAGGDISAEIAPTLVVTQKSLIGGQWHKDSGFTNLTDFNISVDGKVDETLAASLNVQGGPGVRTSVKLYGVVGPFIENGIYGGYSFAVTPYAECAATSTFFGGADARIGGEAKIFGSGVRFTSNPVFYQREFGTEKILCEEDESPPTTPTGLIVTASSATAIDLSWNPATDDIATRTYEVWRRDGRFGTSLGRPVLIEETGRTQYVDSILKPETEYCYYIRAVDQKGNRSPIPIDLECATTKEEVDEEPPTVPQGFAGLAESSTSVSLSWTASTDNDAVGGYLVLDYTNGVENAVRAADPTDTMAVIRNLNPETEYCYVVTAIDVRGNISEASDQVCVTTNPKSEAEWTAFIGCQGREFLLQENLEIEENTNSRVELAASGNDYNGTRLSYILAGVFNPESQSLSADIDWSFEGQSQKRKDRFVADLSTGDSGIVAMDQIQITGCDAQIQFIRRADEVSEKARPVLYTPIPGHQEDGLGAFGEF